MILRICFIFVFIITSTSVHAGPSIVPEEFKNACKTLVGLVKDGTETPEQILNFVSETFVKTDDFSKYKKILALIKEVQTPGLSAPARTQTCQTGFVEDLKVEDIKVEDVNKRSKAQEDVQIITKEEELIVATPISKEPKQLPKKFTKSHCKYGQFEICDGSQMPVTIGISSLEALGDKLKTSVHEPFSIDDCKCLERNLEIDNKSMTAIVKEAEKEYARVNKDIFEATGKKFLDEFATFQEDVGYYERTTATALQKDTSLKLDNKILCTETAAFKKSIDSACAASNMMAGKDARIAALLGVYGNTYKAGPNVLKEGFDDLLKNISMASNKEGQTAEQEAFTREKFDEFRFGLGHENSQPEVMILDELTAKIVQDETLKKSLDAQMNAGATPLAAIESIMSNSKYSERVTKYLKSISNPKCQSIISKWTTMKGVEFDVERNRITDYALNIHPGLKNLLLDRKLFDKTAAGLKNTEHGIIKSAEDNLNFVEHFTERCQSLQKNLAEAVCADPNTLKDKIKKSEMIELLGANKAIGGANEDAVDLLICSTNDNNVVKGSAFDGLIIDESRPFLVSDFRMKNEENENSSFFARTAKKQNDPAFQERVSKISKAFEYERVTTGTSTSEEVLSRPRFNENEFAAQLKQKLSTTHTAQTENAPMSREKTELAAPESTPTQGATKLSHATPFKASSANPDMFRSPSSVVEETKNQEAASPRAELKNVLSNGNQQKISSHIKNINDEDAQELLDLKKQLDKSKGDLADLRKETEAKKMRDLQAKYDALEQKLEALKNGKTETTARTNNPIFPESGHVFKTQGPGHANERSPIVENKTTTEVGKANFAPNSIGSQNQAAINRETNKANNSVIVDSDSETSSQKLVIVSKSIDGKKVSEDPSSELISYLTATETNSKTLKELKELKESGMIYTYDKDENGKIVQVSKLIKYGQLSAAAKALVEAKLAQSELEDEMIQVKRKVSYQALKMELLKIQI